MDVVIVGGGVGGCALGSSLARAGLEVEILERSTVFEDRVRGEWMAPWGVAETQRLGLYDRLLEAGGHHLSRSVNYDELIPVEMAEAAATALSDLLPGVPGPLCLEHVRLQEALLAATVSDGALVRRGVSEVRVRAGSKPGVSFHHQDRSHSRECRLIVGADGRASTVRRQLGLELVEDPIDHLIAGLLVDGADGWPEDLQALGKVGDIHYLVFPQGRGKVRLYADYDGREQARFSGPDGAERFLAAFDMDCVPKSRTIADSTPIGPCRAYPSQCASVDDPRVEGAVLMGDAAGFNDPILGQGLSITLRDARWLCELLTGGGAWEPALFEPWVDERRERMRRLRFVANLQTELFARFDEESLRRRERAVMRMAGDPDLSAGVRAAYVGPERLPAEVFTPEFRGRLFDG